VLRLHLLLGDGLERLDLGALVRRVDPVLVELLRLW
jgi:hypothetical protein